MFYMQKFLPTLLLLFTSLGLYAQTVVTSNYLPSASDSLKFNVADSASLQNFVLHNTGGPFVWNLNDLVAARTSVQYYDDVEAGTQDDAFPNADFKLPTGLLSTNYYQLTNNGLILIGNIGGTAFLEDFVVTTPFNPGYIERHESLEFIDQHNVTSNIDLTISTDSLPQELIDVIGPFIGVADSLRFRTQIERSDLVDAYGTAELGEEIFDVLRERREETRSVILEAHTFLGWVDVTDEIAAGIPTLGQLLGDQDTLVTYSLWSDASIDPIAVISTEANGETITGAIFKYVETTSSTENPFGQVAEISIYPNPARTTTNFKASGLQNGQYQLRVLSITGREMISHSLNALSGSLSTELDISKLPSGLYLYSLTNSRGRIMATKRLFVGGN